MIIVLKPEITEKQIEHIMERVTALGLKPVLSRGIERTIIGVIGKEDVLRMRPLDIFPGVEKVLPILKPYKLVSREFRQENSVIDVEGVSIGGKDVVVIAGPCAVESEKQIIGIAKAVKKAGAKILRGSVFKPRTSPYDFQGLGESGLDFLSAAKKETGLVVETEVMDVRHLDLVAKYVDMVRIGARNMQNFDLLREVGKMNKPVILKRGLSATIKEFLLAAEYVVSSGNPGVILCERGIRTFETETRNTLDLNAVPVIKELSHLPIIVDPSHGTGRASLVEAMSLASVAAGADGLIIEVHTNPEEAWSDGVQSLSPGAFEKLMAKIASVANAVGRKL
ncbi:MAG: 3-deoxy-7-phosphoheptulonate synthase [Candidatus Omnitrophica bacterium]|nr:3-deoxy-7-phosphoheptulonate synthase [Candidatus Omnitrophota bacterium]